MSFSFPSTIIMCPNFINSSFVSCPCFHLPQSTLLLLLLYYYCYTEAQGVSSLFSQPNLLNIPTFFLGIMMTTCAWRRLPLQTCQHSRVHSAFRGASHGIPPNSFLNKVHSAFLNSRVYIQLLTFRASPRILGPTISQLLQPKLMLIILSPRNFPLAVKSRTT